MVRILCVVSIGLGLIVGSAGCQSTPQSEEQIWAQTKIGDLAPRDALPAPQFFTSVAMDVHVLELPAENVDRLDDLWPLLSAKPIHLSSYSGFTENSFRMRAGRMEVLEQVISLLADAGIQKAATFSIVLPSNDTSDLPVADLPVARQITFVGNNLMKQTANVGPGVLALRLRAEPIPWARGVHKIIGYPTYTIPIVSAITPLQERARRNEFYFEPAAFAVQMAPGDLIVIGPDRYTGERLSLGGLFFNKPEGTLFFNPSTRTPPTIRPAVRIYILVCMAIND
jgi:hypothetical protein